MSHWVCQKFIHIIFVPEIKTRDGLQKYKYFYQSKESENWKCLGFYTNFKVIILLSKLQMFMTIQELFCGFDLEPFVKPSNFS